ncbi:MAG: glycosyltransferase [Dehalococcoidia bacterium]|jgi:glycosyltransferase involved in cell wall biosynthesis
MLYHQPLVSICIPTYNAEKTIMHTIGSILNQTYHNLEILVVDNASTDNTLSLLRQVNDPRVVIHRNERNIGAEANFSKCVQLATGEYIAIFHADDLYLPNMVEKQVQAFQDNPAVGSVFTMASRINDRDEIIGESILPAELRGKRVHHFPEIFFGILENGNFLVTPSCMVRGKLYKDLAPFDGDRFGTSADLDMWLRILKKGPIAVLDEKLMSYRVSTTHGSYQFRFFRTEEADFFKVMDYHLSVESGVLDIPRSILNKYEFQRSLDKIIRAISHLNKGESAEARRLLRESLSMRAFRGAMQSIGRPRTVAFWLCGILLLGSGHFGPYIAKSLRWLMRRLDRRVI